jgi:hypothetical protein
MCDDNEVTPCCRRYSRPEEQCDRYPACTACEDLIADDAPTLKEASQHVEAVFGPGAPDFGPPAEAAHDRLY